MRKVHVIILPGLLFTVSILVTYVAPQCFEYCLKVSQTCAKNVASHPVEKLKRKKPCQKGGKKVYCCKTEEGYSKFMTDMKLPDLARTIAGADENEYPHQVQFRGGKGVCGGTIYNKNWIITAAHCITFKNITYAIAGRNDTRIYAGLSSVRQVSEGNKYEIAQIIQHEQWNPHKISQGYDLALLHLARPLKLEIGRIQPIRLEKDDKPLVGGSKAVIIGFGNVHPNLGVGSVNLMEAEVPVHDQATAVRLSLDPLNAEGLGGFVPLPQHASIGGGDSGVTVGKGDSGGPFICANEDNKPVLCGVASFKRCKQYKICKQPNYYIRIAPFLDWIKSKTNNERQEEEFFFNEPMFPTKVGRQNIPGYLVRIAGGNKSCSGVLMNKKVVLTPAECIQANGGQAKLNVNTIIYHYSTGKHLLAEGPVTYHGYKQDISQNISAFLHRPLGLNDNAFILLKKPFTEGETIQLAPKDFNLENKASIEYTMNEKVHSVEARRYLPLDREECQHKIHTIDDKFKLDEQHLCMRQVYSAETECDRDIGGPLICSDNNGRNYLCGMKIFHGCRFSGFPQIFNNYLSGHLRQVVEASLRSYSG